MRKKRGPKIKVHNGPLPEHLKLLAKLCIKHDGPGNLTYWDRIFEEAEQLSEELFIMIKERRAKYPTFKKSRLRFLVDSQYRKAFNDYRANCELAMGRHPPPSSVIQDQKMAVAKAKLVPQSQVIQTVPADDSWDNLPSHLKQFAEAIAQSELGTGGEACYECLRRYAPEAKDFDKLDLKTKQAVLHFKDTMKEHLNCNMIQPYHFDYNFTIDGMQHFQNFMAKQNEHSSLYNLRSTSRELPCMRLSIRMNGTSCIDSPCAWLYKLYCKRIERYWCTFEARNRSNPISPKSILL